MPDNRTQGQKDAEANMAKAIEQMAWSYREESEKSAILVDWVAVASFQRFDEEGDMVTAVDLLFSEDIPMYRLLGMAREGLLNIEDMIREDEMSGPHD